MDPGPSRDGHCSLIDRPSIAVAWPELFTSSGDPDLPEFGTISWQAQIYGNRVNSEYIAGIVYIAQDFGTVIQGFISSIDTATGHFKVASVPGTDGVECVLNDPTGVFGHAYTDHPLWVRFLFYVRFFIQLTAGYSDC